MYLISTGWTTYEVFKRNQVYAQRQEQAVAAAAVATAEAAIGPAGPTELSRGVAPGQMEVPMVQQQGNGSAWVRGGSSSSNEPIWWHIEPWRSRRQTKLQHAAVKPPPPPYDRGLWQNWCEVLWPEHFLSCQAGSQHSSKPTSESDTAAVLQRKQR